MLMIAPIATSVRPQKRSIESSSKWKRFSEELEDKEANDHNASGSSIQMNGILNGYKVTVNLEKEGASNDTKIPYKSNLYFSDIGILNEDTEASGSPKVCPECQSTYRKNSMKGHAVVPYIGMDEQVQISI